MAKKHVVCSFDFEHDRKYYYLLKAWDSNPNINFYMSDCTPKEIQSDDIATIKRTLSSKIGEAKYMVAIIGKHSNDLHKDNKEIGYRNWQSYEIAKNNEKGNGLVVVRLDSNSVVPDEAYGVGAEWVSGFDEEKIKKALEKLSK